MGRVFLNAKKASGRSHGPFRAGSSLLALKSHQVAPRGRVEELCPQGIANAARSFGTAQSASAKVYEALAGEWGCDANRKGLASLWLSFFLVCVYPVGFKVNLSLPDIFFFLQGTSANEG